jgi:peptidoglycan-N-acetylglucosamine deacetylase
VSNLGKDVRWPEGKRAGAVISFDFDAEEVWIGEDPKNADRPGVLSQGTYGAKIAVPLILDLLKEKDITATFFVPGRVAELHPDRVKEIIAAGHEVALHGYTHRSPALLTVDEERDELDRSLKILRDLGAEPVGYRSPSWDFSHATLDLLEEFGVFYSSNMMDSIYPYQHPGRPLIELPVSWLLDDAPHFWFDGVATWTKKISTTSEVRQIWQEEFEGIRDLGGLFTWTMHPQISGRPSRLRMVADFIDYLKSQPTLWIATARTMAETVIQKASA